MTETDNLKLKLIEGKDIPSYSPFNENMNKIDDEMSSLKTSNANVLNKVTVLENKVDDEVSKVENNIETQKQWVTDNLNTTKNDISEQLNSTVSDLQNYVTNAKSEIETNVNDITSSISDDVSKLKLLGVKFISTLSRIGLGLKASYRNPCVIPFDTLTTNNIIFSGNRFVFNEPGVFVVNVNIDVTFQNEEQTTCELLIVKDFVQDVSKGYTGTVVGRSVLNKNGTVAVKGMIRVTPEELSRQSKYAIVLNSISLSEVSIEPTIFNGGASVPILEIIKANN